MKNHVLRPWKNVCLYLKKTEHRVSDYSNQKTLVSFLFALLSLFLASKTYSQPIKPAVFLSQIEMTPSGGQPYDEFYWLNSNNASLTKSGVNFPVTGTYRCDLSAYLSKGTPSINVLIDGIVKGTVTVNSSAIGIFSASISNISAGTHTITLQLGNFNSAANYGRVGLVYFTPTTDAQPYVYPAITPLSFTPAVTLLTANHFGSGHLRGFCLGSNGSNQSGESDQSMKDMVATGANIARCFVQIERPSGSEAYQFVSGELAKLDTTVARGKRLGFYVVPVLFHDPSLNTDYWGNAARKSSIVNLWKTLASKYKGNPVIAAYDLINEPRQNFNYAEVIRWQSDMIDTIRAIDPDHVVMVECIDNDMFAMMLPLAYPNVVYSPHGYSTLMITHEGVAGESSANVRNKYPTLSGTANLPAPWGKTQLSTQHDDVRIMTHRFHVPVFIGEFSCINWAPMNDSSKWTSTTWVNDNISLLEAEGWSWAYHTWRGDYVGWEAEIPSSYYNQFSFSNATPQGLPSYSTWVKARSDTAPTIVMLKNWFKSNSQGPSQTNNTYYKDSDGDGYGSASDTVMRTSQPAGYVTQAGDCNDNNASVHPGAVEICGNGIDDNCDGRVDEGCTYNTYYKDADSDGYGKTSDTVMRTSQPAGYVSQGGDCNDNNASVHPGAVEICGNGIDDNCDGRVDEGCTYNTYYKDADNDGYGKTSDTLMRSSQPAGYVTKSGDCDDNNASVHPGAVEICGNGIDDNCDGRIDEGCTPSASVSINDVTVSSTQTSATLTVSLSNKNTTSTSVNYTTINGTATSPKNYKSTKGTITIPAGSLTGTINVSLSKNKLSGSIYFDVKLSNPVNAAFNDSSGRVTIQNAAAFSTAQTAASLSPQTDEAPNIVTIKVRPNPSAYHFNLYINSISGEPVLIRITDVEGRILEAKQITVTNGAFEIGENLKPGIYIVEAIQGKQKVQTKIVKI